MSDDTTLRVKATGDVSDAERAFDKLGDSAEKAGKRVAKGITVTAGDVQEMGARAGELFSNALAGGIDAEVANAKLAGQLGLTAEDAATYGRMAGDIFSQNLGGSLEDVNETIRAVRQNLEGFGDQTPADIQKASESAQILADTFGVDVASAAKAASSLMRNDLAKDSTEAFDIIAAGFRDGVNVSDDFLETINEYSPQFAKLGITGSEVLGLLGDGLKAGARDTDVIADAFKEFSLRSIDGSKLTSEAYKTLGMDAKATSAAIAAGGLEANGATRDVLAALLEIKDPIKQNQAGVALFGTQWEDTLRQILPAMVESGDASDRVAGSIEVMGKTAGDTASGQIESLKRGFSTWTGEMAQSQGAIGLVVTGLGMFGGSALSAAGDVGMFASGLRGLGLVQGITRAATAISTAAQWAWNAALSANPIGLVILAIAALVAGLVWFFTKTETGRKVWAAAMAAMSAGIQWLKTSASSAIQWISTKWDAMVTMFRTAPGKVSGSLRGMFTGLRDGFRSAINYIISGWNRLSFGIPGFSFAGVSVPGMTVSVPKIPMLAAGGIVTRPTLALIGEAGPEAVVPLTGGMSGVGGVSGGQVVKVYVTQPLGSPDAIGKAVRDALARSGNRGYGYGAA